MAVRFGEREFRGDEVLSIKRLAKAFDGRTLFSDVDLEVEGGERIALLGDNGSGKTTLLKILLGEEQPDAGKVRMGPTVKVGYLPQHVHFDHPERNLVDTLIYEQDCTAQTARNRLAAFKFRGEDVFKPVSALSGGEQSRLRLCRLIREFSTYSLGSCTSLLSVISLVSVFTPSLNNRQSQRISKVRKCT